MAVLFTPNDLTHKYPLQPKQQMLALTNGQIQEGICWRSANLQPQRTAAAQHLRAADPARPATAWTAPTSSTRSHNRPGRARRSAPAIMGMSVNSFHSVSGDGLQDRRVGACQSDQTGAQLHLRGLLHVEHAARRALRLRQQRARDASPPTTPRSQRRAWSSSTATSAPAEYSFSSPDHFDVNDVLPSQVPLLEQIADVMAAGTSRSTTSTSACPASTGASSYDTFTAPGLPNYIPNVPPALVDPTFTNRTRSLILNIQNPVRPTQSGLMDTYSSVVSANLHLQNGVTGSVFLSKKADRDVASHRQQSRPAANTFPLYGLPTKYDFFIFSRDHYWTLKGASFELIDQGYAMCLVDDGTGTGTKVAKLLHRHRRQLLRALHLRSLLAERRHARDLELPAQGDARRARQPERHAAHPRDAQQRQPAGPRRPDQQALQPHLRGVRRLHPRPAARVHSHSGRRRASVQAAPILGAPGFNGYSLNVVGANHQPVQISQIYSGSIAYPIAGSTTIVPSTPRRQKAVPFYGSISHGLDKQVSVASCNPRT